MPALTFLKELMTFLQTSSFAIMKTGQVLEKTEQSVKMVILCTQIYDNRKN